MLNNLKRKSAALQSFSFEDELKAIISSNTDKIADLQRDQLAKGKDSNSDYIKLKDNSAYGFGYRPYTINRKKGIAGTGGITSHVTWFMTGELHKSIKAFISGEKFSLKSSDFKFSKLITRSGEEAIGLNKESRTDFIMKITRPQILKAFKTKVIDI